MFKFFTESFNNLKNAVSNTVLTHSPQLKRVERLKSPGLNYQRSRSTNHEQINKEEQ